MAFDGVVFNDAYLRVNIHLLDEADCDDALVDPVMSYVLNLKCRLVLLAGPFCSGLC